MTAGPVEVVRCHACAHDVDEHDDRARCSAVVAVEPVRAPDVPMVVTETCTCGWLR